MSHVSHNVRGRKVLVAGLGLHGGGVSVARWLCRHGAQVTVTDLKTRSQLAVAIQQLKGLNIDYVVGRHRVKDFTSTQMIIQNPGFSYNSRYLAAARRAGVPIENEASLFFAECPAPILGVTGTRGKSTTAALLTKLLRDRHRKVWLVGNIRTNPMLSIVDRVGKNDLVVVELSSFQLETLGRKKLSPHVAVVTNLLPDHLNRYATVSAYQKAKRAIVANQQEHDVAVLNLDDKQVLAFQKSTLATPYFFSQKVFSKSNGAFVRGGKIFLRRRGQTKFIISASQLGIRGEHNLANALAALAAAGVYTENLVQLRDRLRRWPGLPDRFETVRVVRGVTYINDTTASTPDATMAALKTLWTSVKTKRVILIAGGSDKRIPRQKFVALGKLMRQTCKATILFDGPGSKNIIPAGQVVTGVQAMSEAVGIASQFAKPGDVVLLSPACASFSNFVNEFDRGGQFRTFVKQL